MSVTHANVPNDHQKGEVQFTCGTVASAGDNTAISAPSNQQEIVVLAFSIQQESQTGMVIKLKDDDDNEVWRIYTAGDGEGTTVVLNEPWHVGKQNAVELNLDNANTVGYSFQYYIQQIPA